MSWCYLTLGQIDNDVLGNIPTKNELLTAVNILKESKSPGMDGIPIEFYKCFWTELKDPFLKMITDSWEKRNPGKFN